MNLLSSITSAPSHIVPYIILAINTIICLSLRRLITRYCPASFHVLVTEVLATFELCADCAELGVVWEVHGNIGYGVTLFALCLMWCLTWEDAEACPNGPLEDCFLLGHSLVSPTIFLKLMGQFIAASFVWRYCNLYWSMHLIPSHISLNTQPCVAGLQVSMLYGAVVEAFITFISRFVALESSFWETRTAAAINSATTVALCIFALDSSGGFFNPILASALTYNCMGNNMVQHIFVYWIGSFTGSIVARALHLLLRGTEAYVKED